MGQLRARAEGEFVQTHLSKDDGSLDGENRESRFVVESTSDRVDVVQLGPLDEEYCFESKSFVRRVGEERGEEGEERG